MRIQGIYKIINLVNGKIYVGLSKNIKRRFSSHKSAFKTLTKYEYYIYKDDNLIEVCGYKKLVELGFKNANVNFSRLKSDTCNCKKHKIVRMKI